MREDRRPAVARHACVWKLRRVHKATRNVEQIKPPQICELGFIPGLKKLERSTKGKKTRLEVFQEALSQTSLRVFQEIDHRNGFRKLLFDLECMQKSILTCGGDAVFGTWGTWGDTFALIAEQSKLPTLRDDDAHVLKDLFNTNYLRALVQTHKRISQKVFEIDPKTNPRWIPKGVANTHCVL